MLTYDIPINIKVSAETEEQAEEIITRMMELNSDKPVLLRQIHDWDFIIFAFEEEEHDPNPPGV